MYDRSSTTYTLKLSRDVEGVCLPFREPDLMEFGTRLVLISSIYAPLVKRCFRWGRWYQHANLQRGVFNPRASLSHNLEELKSWDLCLISIWPDLVKSLTVEDVQEMGLKLTPSAAYEDFRKLAVWQQHTWSDPMGRGWSRYVSSMNSQFW